MWFRSRFRLPAALPALLAGALVLVAGCERSPVAPVPARSELRTPARPDEPGARERVRYPRGDCQTQWIEVQLYEPDRGWVPHPEHPRIRAGEIHAEEAIRLLDLRVRCIDFGGERAPSEWVRGVELEPRPVASGKEAPR